MTFKVKSGINVGNLNVIDSDSKYQQTAALPVNKPTLMLDFINTQALDTRLTFARSSNGTFISQRGLIETATTGVPRFDYANNVCQGVLIEDQRTNYVTYSGDFTYSSWAKNASATINHAATTAPDGSTSADIIISAGINSGVYRFVGGLANNTIYTMSVYVKNISGISTVTVGCDVNPTGASVVFNFSTGTITSVGGSVTWSRADNIGNGWFRVGCSFTSTAANPSFIIYPNSAGQFAVWGPQVEVNYGATSYIRSTETFSSRATTATYQDSTDNLIKYAGVNLLTYSNAFSTAPWTKGGNTTLTANAAVAPDGTNTAWRLTMTATSGTFLDQAFSATSGVTYTFSVYAKSDSAVNNQFQIFVWTSAASGSPASGSSTTTVTANSTWTRYSVQFTAATTGTFSVAIDNNLNTLAPNVLIWGAQVEVGSSPTLYSVTTSSTTAGVRPLYNPFTRVNSGQLLEAAATNLIYPSNVGAGWTYTTTTLNDATAPDGTLTASTTTVPTGSFTQPYIGALPVTSSTVYTFSFYVKLGTFTPVSEWLIAVYDETNSTFITFNITPNITPVTHEWRRVVHTFTTPATCTAARCYMFRNSSVTTGGTIFTWGAQLETGYFASSVIPTTTATVTRAVDVYTSATTTRQYDSLSTTNTSWFDPTQGTFVMDFETMSTTNSPFILVSGPEYITGRGGFNSIGTWDGTTEVNVTNSLANTAEYASFGVSWSSAGKLLSLNGSVPIVNTNSTFSPTMPGTFTFGSTTGGGRSMLGHIKRVAYYPQRVSNNELQALTKI